MQTDLITVQMLHIVVLEPRCNAVLNTVPNKLITLKNVLFKHGDGIYVFSLSVINGTIILRIYANKASQMNKITRGSFC